jgi:hypothetical protein
MNQHIKRLEAKRKNDQILQQEQDKKPGSGKIWKNKLTKPAAPNLTTKTQRKIKHKKADYLVQKPQRRQIDLRNSHKKINQDLPSDQSWSNLKSEKVDSEKSGNKSVKRSKILRDLSTNQLHDNNKPSLISRMSKGNIQDGKYVKDLPSRSKTPTRAEPIDFSGPPDIAELKQRVRDEIRNLNTKGYDYEL